MIKREWHGYIIGDVHAAGEILGVSGPTFTSYTNRKWTSPGSKPPPTAVARDTDTPRKLYPLRKIEGAVQDPPVPVPYTVEEWQEMRRGPGWHGGTGGWFQEKPVARKAMNDDELHESFYRSERYKESPTERLARELGESS